mmetsp:Transcript_37991/g.75121  ORF Transcript_37991/g.75121 Transcript_37991/m.75121 type:complete len:245 (-) Transcript_37991:329-1063(-)
MAGLDTSTRDAPVPFHKPFRPSSRRTLRSRATRPSTPERLADFSRFESPPKTPAAAVSEDGGGGSCAPVAVVVGDEGAASSSKGGGGEFSGHMSAPPPRHPPPSSVYARNEVEVKVEVEGGPPWSWGDEASSGDSVSGDPLTGGGGCGAGVLPPSWPRLPSSGAVSTADKEAGEEEEDCCCWPYFILVAASQRGLVMSTVTTPAIVEVRRSSMFFCPAKAPPTPPAGRDCARKARRNLMSFRSP